MISRVVVPLDLSEASEAAVPLAAYLAQHRDIPMTLLHVLEMSPEFMAYSEGVSQVDALLELEETSQKYMRDIADQLPVGQVDTVVLRGRPASQLVHYVDNLEGALIVMSSHGHSGFRRMVVGSVAAKVVQTVSAPVMLVRAPEEDATDIKQPTEIRRVVVPLDGSDFAEHALNATYDLVTREDIAIRLVRVPEIAAYPATMYGAASYHAVDAYMDAMRNESQLYLENMAKQLSEREGYVSWEVREGATSAAILEAARDFDADLIAMASHGRTGFRRFLMGSVAEQVLREADIPVLVVGPHDDEDDD